MDLSYLLNPSNHSAHFEEWKSSYITMKISQWVRESFCSYRSRLSAVCRHRVFLYRTGLVLQHGRRFIVVEHPYKCHKVMWKRSKGDEKSDVILLLLCYRKCQECRACVVRSVREEQGLTIDLVWLYLTGGSRYVPRLPLKSTPKVVISVSVL